jgi:two-component system, OmpR family, alkaline phosphatase synthesis response regulator PhoP
MSQKVLLVDDVSMFLEVERGYLQRSAVQVLTARDGKEAFEVCRAERPDLVFMDLHMPVLNGADSCRAMKRHPQLSTTAVVLITSEGKEEDRQLCLQAGCDGFLTKPLDRIEFLEMARQLLPNLDRRDTRVGCRIRAKYRAFGVTLSGMIEDLSQQGAYLATETEMEKGTVLDVVFALPDPYGAVIHAKVRVAWLNTSNSRRKPSLPEGFGLEFIGVSDQAAQELERYIAGEARVT